jgi:hypothetical protein
MAGRRDEGEGGRKEGRGKREEVKRDRRGRE